MKVRPTSLNPGRQAHFTPFFAPHVPLSRTSGALRKRIRLETGGESVLRRRWEVVPGKPVAARGLVNGWMALAPDGMERSGRFSRHHLPSTEQKGDRCPVRPGMKEWEAGGAKEISGKFNENSCVVNFFSYLCVKETVL